MTHLTPLRFGALSFCACCFAMHFAHGVRAQDTTPKPEQPPPTLAPSPPPGGIAPTPPPGEARPGAPATPPPLPAPGPTAPPPDRTPPPATRRGARPSAAPGSPDAATGTAGPTQDRPARAGQRNQQPQQDRPPPRGQTTPRSAPAEPGGRGQGDRTDGEFERWRAAQQRLLEQQRQTEFRRWRPRVDALVASSDRAAIERVIDGIDGSSILDPNSKAQLTAPLRDRLVLLLCGEAVTALAAGNIAAGRMHILAATNSYGERTAGAPANVVGAIAQAQARYVDAAVGKSESAARAGDYETAIAHADQARAMLALLVRSSGPEAELAKRRVGQVDQLLVKHQVNKTMAAAKRAEARQQLRLSLYYYREAQRAGVDTRAAIERLASHKRSPGLEAGLSLLVPGLSQLTHDRLLAGSGFFLGTTGTAVAGILLNASAEDRYEDYQAAEDPQRAKELYDGIWPREFGAYALIGTAVVIHLWNIIDAYSDAKEHNRMHFQ